MENLTEKADSHIGDVEIGIDMLYEDFDEVERKRKSTIVGDNPVVSNRILRSPKGTPRKDAYKDKLLIESGTSINLCKYI